MKITKTFLENEIRKMESLMAVAQMRVLLLFVTGIRVGACGADMGLLS